MSIAHELSTEVATAILAAKKQTGNVNELKEIVLRVHVALQKLAAECCSHNRLRRLKSREVV